MEHEIDMIISLTLKQTKEHSGSVVECWTRDRGAADSASLRTVYSDFIWSYLAPFMGVIPNQQMAFFLSNFMYCINIFPFFYDLFSQMYKKKVAFQNPN